MAQASTGARLAALGGGFTAVSTGNVMRGQIQVLGVPDPEEAAGRVLAVKASELAVVEGAAGLACNLGALYTLVMGGIRILQP